MIAVNDSFLACNSYFVTEPYFKEINVFINRLLQEDSKALKRVFVDLLLSVLSKGDKS